MLLTAIVFVLLLSGLVIVHELGHFVAARWAKVRVEQFSIFFPPHVWKTKPGETEYAIGIIPLGGYVRLYGEDPTPPKGSEGVSDLSGNGSFTRASVGWRLLIIVAGVAMNLLTTVVLLWAGFIYGMPPVVSTPSDLGITTPPEVIVSLVAPGSAAERAGMQVGDQVLGYERMNDLQTFTKEHQGETLDFMVKRGGETVTVTATLATEGAPLGIGLAEATIIKTDPLTALRLSVLETGHMVTKMAAFVKDFFVGLFTRAEVAEDVTGPVGIFVFTGQAIQLGFAFVLQLAAMISVNLALVNILPFPGLDGGRALFVVLEGIFHGKVVHERYEAILHAIGFWLLISLFVVITIRDVARFF